MPQQQSQSQSQPPPRPSSSASINSFHFEQLHLLLLLFILLFYLFSYVCVCLLNLPQFGIVASQVRVLSLSLRSCSTTSPAASSSSFVRRGRMLIIISSVLPSVWPRLSALSVSAAARNFVGKLRLMIMFNELYNKYIAAAAATEAAATAHGTWTPKIAGTLRKVPEFMSLSLSFCLHHLSLPLCELCLPLLHLTATLIQLGAAVIYEKQRQRGLTRAAHTAQAYLRNRFIFMCP